MQARNSRIGLILFWIYFVFYLVFMLLNALLPDTMGMTPVPGVNLAVLYGFALILSAFVLAVLYGLLCRPDAGNDDEVQG